MKQPYGCSANLSSNFGRLHRQVLSVVASLALAVGLFVFAGPLSAQALPAQPVPPVVGNPDDAVAADALPTAQINGIVLDQEIVGNTVYAVGEFTQARPAGSPPGRNESARYNILSYDLRTGELNAWAPKVNGRIRTVAASPDGSRIYIGGSFNRVNDEPRWRIAAFDTRDGSLVRSFRPAIGSDVFAIAPGSDAIYIGGWFTSVNGLPRARLAALNAQGEVLGWAPSASGTVYGIGLTAAEDRVVVAGSFAALNGSTATSIGSLDARTGTSYPFAANRVVHNRGNTAALMSLKIQDDKAFSTGYWFGGTGNFEGGIIADAYNGTVLNLMNCLGDTYDIEPMNGLAYMVSHHHQCSDSGGFPETQPRMHQHTDAFTIEATGKVQPNTYNYPNFAGHPSGSPVVWFPTMTPGNYSRAWQAGWTLESKGEYLAVGGEFTAVNGVPQQGLVRFATKKVVKKPAVGPHMGAEMMPTIRSLSEDSLKLRFQSSHDPDGNQLSYSVVREDLGAHRPVHVMKGVSTFWARPLQEFVDRGLVHGRSYRYRVDVSDQDGNTRLGQWMSHAVGDGLPQITPYSRQVRADGATHYWRLGESDERIMYDWGSQAVDLKTFGGVSAGDPGAILNSTEGAAAFSGDRHGYAATLSSEAATSAATAELWFKTTTTQGGRLLGMGSSYGDSLTHDRNIYLNNAGQLTFAADPHAIKRVTSEQRYNDGEWHHVVATISPGGMRLFVDGVRVGFNSAATSTEPMQGYWQLGGGNLNGWPATGSSRHFAGTIDEAAIYPTALTQDQIRDHYRKSGRSFDVPSVADDYGRAVRADEPWLYWRFDEHDGSVIGDFSGNAQNGEPHGNPGFGRPSEVVPGGSAMSFDGRDDSVGAVTPVTNPTVFSIETWFNTTTTTGGKILGFGNHSSGLSTRYDRHLYLNPEGQLNFGVWPGSATTITSSDRYNDGHWHHAVATLGPDGMKLYVDGQLVANGPNTQAENFTGYWRVGGDQTWSGAPYFAGQIDETAVYDQVLSKERVLAHYRVSGAARNLPPEASASADCRGLTCTLKVEATDPDGTVSSIAWDFGDGTTASGTTAEHTYRAAGTYVVKATVTDNLKATSVAETTATVRQPAAVPRDHYGRLIHADDPRLFWRLDEPQGELVQDASSWASPGRYSGRLSHGGTPKTGLSGSAVWFESGSAAVTQDRFSSPNTFSLETWFNTTARNGRLMGFGNAQNGSSTQYDRHLYLESDGRMTFGVWSTQAHTISTPQPVNDGAWHHAVATFGSDGMKLYLDGQLVADNANTKSDRYQGYWRLGTDRTWSGEGGYVGSLDESAVYNTVLTPQQVAAHHAAAQGNKPPSASFDVKTSHLTVATDGSTSTDADGQIVSYTWDFGDKTTATGAKATHTYTSAGEYDITLIVKDDRGATTSVSKRVKVSAPANAAPTASFSWTADHLSARFDASSSRDTDGKITNYVWDFGDGKSATGQMAQHTYPKPGTYRVTLTVTDDKGATAKTTQNVKVAAQPTLLAHDDFNRTVASGWGEAKLGGPWTPSSAKAFSVRDKAGLVNMSLAGQTHVARLPQAQAQNVSMRVGLSLDRMVSGSGYQQQILVRTKDAKTHYFMSVRVTQDGAAQLYLAKSVGGKETLLRFKSVPAFGYSNKDTLMLKIDVFGDNETTIAGTLWRSSDPEPAEPTLSATDSTPELRGTGGIGLKFYTGASMTSVPLTVKVTDLKAEQR